MKGMKGWKTNAGAAIAAITQLLVSFGVITPEVGHAIETLGVALATIGIGHKLDKVAGSKDSASR